MDSVKNLSLYNEKFSRLHSKAPRSGHIHKGHSTVSQNATIPSKYETYVIENTDNKGFNSSAKRFNYEFNETSLPGVGFYNSQSDLYNDSPSFSKRGTGSFASKNRYAQINPTAEIPAPNIYYVKSTESKLDFNRSNFTKNFHPDIAVKTEDKNTQLPAPNLYDIPSTIGEKNNISSFKSKTNRDNNLIADTSKRPGPGQYSINKADKIMTHNQTAIQSVFKSNSKRDTFKPPEGPGPSDYNLNKENIAKISNDQRFIRKHYLCLAASALKLPPTPPLPGPGKYNITTTIGEPNHYMSSSMFTSSASRWTKPGTSIGLGMGDGKTGFGGEEFPGPAHYQPIKPIKQSFHYNISNKWL